MKANDDDISDKTQRELAACVLKQAAQDLSRFHGATTKVERELYYDAYSWVMSNDYSWPFSFHNVSRLLNRQAEELRHELIGELSFGAFGQWARRCSRAVRWFSDVFTQRFATEYNLSPTPPSGSVQPLH